MRLAFYASRAPHFKCLCPVAAAARRRGDDTLLLIPGVALRGPKDDVGLDYHRWVPDTLFSEVREIADPVDAEVRLRDVDWAVAVGLRTAPAIRASTRASGVRWAALDSYGDNLTYVLEGGKDALADWDLATTLAEGPRHLAGVVLDEDFGRAVDELTPVGYPELDQLTLPGMTREACRAKWNLPAGRIVLLAPAARPANLGRLRRWAWGRWTYPWIARQIRRWCDRHGAILVTKTRAKHGDPPWLAGLSDFYIGETCAYPFDTLELVVAADVVVGFVSTLAVEASAAGRPQVWIHAWPPEASEWPVNLPLRQRFFLEPGGLWNTTGVRQMHGFGPNWRAHLQAWTEAGRWPEPTEASRAAMRAAVERWAGPVDGKASERFLDVLETRR